MPSTRVAATEVRVAPSAAATDAPATRSSASRRASASAAVAIGWPTIAASPPGEDGGDELVAQERPRAVGRLARVRRPLDAAHSPQPSVPSGSVTRTSTTVRRAMVA